MRPCQEGWDDKTDALPGPRRRKTQHMFGTIMPEIAALELAKHHTVRRGQTRGAGPVLATMGMDAGDAATFPITIDPLIGSAASSTGTASWAR